MTSGQRIKAAREARAWSQEDVAKAADLSYRTVWAAENGLVVSPRSLKAIADALALDFAELKAAVAS